MIRHTISKDINNKVHIERGLPVLHWYHNDFVLRFLTNRIVFQPHSEMQSCLLLWLNMFRERPFNEVYFRIRQTFCDKSWRKTKNISENFEKNNQSEIIILENKKHNYMVFFSLSPQRLGSWCRGDGCRYHKYIKVNLQNITF